MEFNFGSKMKTLRKRRDLTQEQLAERLGVSPQSISKWETNAAFPDITMFPVLASFYGVTTDELLGVDITKTEETINNYIDEIYNLYHQWKHDDMITLCRKANHEFPASDKLRYQLAWCLNQTGSKNRDEAISVFKSILEDSSDTHYRLLTISQLCYCYHWLGDDKTALEYANQLPNLNSTRMFLIGRLGLYRGQEKIDFSRMCVDLYFTSLFEVANQLSDVRYLDEENNLPNNERIGILESLLKILNASFGDNLLGRCWDAYALHRNIAILHLHGRKKEAAYLHLDKAYEYAVLYDKYSDDEAYDTPLFNGVHTLPHSHWSQSALDDFRNEFSDPKNTTVYDLIKDEAEFIAFVGKLNT
jgi:transcriptional regulator with XRE-family HTH domain